MTAYDIAIIGGGPAGLTAGLYAARARLNTVLIEKLNPGGQVLTTDWVENYPGFPDGVSAQELTARMTEQAKRFGLQTLNDEVESCDLSDSPKVLRLSEGDISAKAVIVAAGASPRRLGAEGENRFIGKGISSCATCDGPIFKDRVVAAVGGGDTAVQESVFLTKFAKKVYLIHRRDRFRAQKILSERAQANEKIEIIWNSAVDRVAGLSHLENIRVVNVKTGETRILQVNGMFVWIGLTPNTQFLNNQIRLDESGFVMTDSHMAASLPGVFAAGDARATPLRQIVTATGDAAIAAMSAEHYIEGLKS